MITLKFAILMFSSANLFLDLVLTCGAGTVAKKDPFDIEQWDLKKPSFLRGFPNL